MREIGGLAAIIGIILIVGFLIVGPQGCDRHMSSWKASSYGSDWLVVQYSQNGDVINYWELNNKSVGSEESSDGIYFKDNSGNVVHLSGHYIYVQASDMEAAKKRFLKED